MSILSKNAILSNIFRTRSGEMAAAEGLDAAAIEAAVNAGAMVILANPAHTGVTPTVIGQPAKVKVNANIGTSMLVTDVAMEMEKVALCKSAGAHTLMDLSTAGDLAAIRSAILAATDLPLGTVPLYGVAQRHIARGGDPSDFTVAEILAEIAHQAEAGVDFMTLHCGITRRGVELASQGGRVTGIVSRGGS
ncbi:MAG: phosphomethylpyrimidine synthase ThiC, partial [Acidobacteriota bacterium]